MIIGKEIIVGPRYENDSDSLIDARCTYSYCYMTESLQMKPFTLEEFRTLGLCLISKFVAWRSFLNQLAY
ncbi:hypothetical protein K1719_002494 [Acacia pycnantha]|nr:hypothetical protein K1719_002494 [Acacia pycnantha]